MTRIIHTTMGEITDNGNNNVVALQQRPIIRQEYRKVFLAAHGFEPDESTGEVDWWTRVQKDSLVKLATRTTVTGYGIEVDASNASAKFDEDEVHDWCHFVKSALQNLNLGHINIYVI
jgi:hypothetical protein